MKRVEELLKELDCKYRSLMDKEAAIAVMKREQGILEYEIYDLKSKIFNETQLTGVTPNESKG